MLYAKSNPKESIKEHTDNLLKNLEKLKQAYGEKILENKNIDKEEFWKELKLACTYHDVGKVYTPFQNMIKAKLGEELEKTEFSNNIKHEQLSPLFIPEECLPTTRDKKKILFQSIYYHHTRKDITLNRETINRIIEKDIIPRIEQLEQELGILLNHSANTIYLGYVGADKRIQYNDETYEEYCLLKGLLHRLDHSSSAHVEIEEITDDKINDNIKENMQENGFTKNELQKFCEENKDKNLVIVGSTGIGKTEAGLLWSNGEKTFFTLPIRISINAIYDRIKDTYKYEHVGLLHSTSLDYLESKTQEGDENSYIENEEAKNLSRKITTCTIDQIFPFVFKYAGYEKIYATMSYSKIIIDEIQAYAPEVVAIIIYGLEMIYKMGGKFLIMTATLPRIYRDQLEKRGIKFETNKFLSNIKRHRIKMNEREIQQDIEDIIKKSQNGKVLIIVNTVNKAIEMYNKIKKITNSVDILHSRFIIKDKEEKESKIKEFAEEKAINGIWITTQIVEASLDIDFDYLYTEMSSLDSLFQRLGRCYRKRELQGEECNINIYTENVTGIGSIYDKEIYQKSIELLKSYDEKILSEEDKAEMVDSLYSKESLEGTEFIKKFEKGLHVLENIIDYETSKEDAIKMLRHIENVKVIPKGVYDENIELFENYKNEKEYSTKKKLRKEIEKISTNITLNQARKLKDKLFDIGLEEIKGIDTKYTKETGLIIEQSIDEDIDSRSF